MFDNDMYSSSLFLVIVLVTLILVLVPTIFYLLTLQRTFDAITPENRLMSSGQVGYY